MNTGQQLISSALSIWYLKYAACLLGRAEPLTHFADNTKPILIDLKKC